MKEFHPEYCLFAVAPLLLLCYLFGFGMEALVFILIVGAVTVFFMACEHLHRARMFSGEPMPEVFDMRDEEPGPTAPEAPAASESESVLPKEKAGKRGNFPVGRKQRNIS